MDSDRLVFMDLEMTGLDPEREFILEVATIITDGQLEIIAEGPELVIHHSDAVLAGMDAWNTEHHGKSGLTARSRESTTTVEEADRLTLEFVQKHIGAKVAPLAGNSIHQDRLFVTKYMPALTAHLHYRNVDVSTLKELVKRWSPVVYDARPSKRGSHRALGDIRESIEELRYYRQHAFKI